MKKHSFLAIILALAMVLCCAIGVSAAENPVVYTVDGGTTAAINVIVTIEGNGLPFDSIPVSLAQSTTSHKVVNALLSSAVSTAGYTFCGTDGDPITTSSTYFSTIKKGDVSYGGTGSGYNGWCFRVNGGIPQEREGWGATIATTTIHNGDVIAVHIDDPISESATTRFMRASVTSATATSVIANVTESHQYYGTSWNDWNTTNFSAVTGKSFTAKIYASASLGRTPIATTTMANGVVTFSNLNLTVGQTYYLVVEGNMNTSETIHYSTCITAFTVSE